MHLEQLEHQVVTELKNRGAPEIRQIDFGPGSEDANLASNVDVRVYLRDGSYRDICFYSAKFVQRYFFGEWDRSKHPCPEMADLLTTGRPMVVAAEINGDTIVRGAIRHLELEPR